MWKSWSAPWHIANLKANICVTYEWWKLCLNSGNSKQKLPLKFPLAVWNAFWMVHNSLSVTTAFQNVLLLRMLSTFHQYAHSEHQCARFWLICCCQGNRFLSCNEALIGQSAWGQALLQRLSNHQTICFQCKWTRNITTTNCIQHIIEMGSKPLTSFLKGHDINGVYKSTQVIQHHKMILLNGYYGQQPLKCEIHGLYVWKMMPTLCRWSLGDVIEVSRHILIKRTISLRLLSGKCHKMLIIIGLEWFGK